MLKVNLHKLPCFLLLSNLLCFLQLKKTLHDFSSSNLVKLDLDLDPGPHSEKLLDVDPHKMNADPQPCLIDTSYQWTDRKPKNPNYFAGSETKFYPQIWTWNFSPKKSGWKTRLVWWNWKNWIPTFALCDRVPVPAPFYVPGNRYKIINFKAVF